MKTITTGIAGCGAETLAVLRSSAPELEPVVGSIGVTVPDGTRFGASGTLLSEGAKEHLLSSREYIPGVARVDTYLWDRVTRARVTEKHSVLTGAISPLAGQVVTFRRVSLETRYIQLTAEADVCAYCGTDNGLGGRDRQGFDCCQCGNN